MPTWRYGAQNVLTGRWIDFDLPLKVDAEQPRIEMSGAGSLTGTINGDHPTLRDPKTGARLLQEWQTALYAELDGRIVWGGILQGGDFDGPTWTVQAFGFTSYLNGTPYLGDYQRFVDTDPGIITAALWAYVQSQPDGNLGVRLRMPADLGPNIGDADQPYELAWWESKDVGSEFQQLAGEAPFDYVERHAYVGSPSVAQPPTIRFGYGNLQGGYDGKDKSWMKKRADPQAALIASMHVHLFVAIELHEETSDAMPDGASRWFEGRLKKKAGSAWTLADGDGGNQLLYRSDLYVVLDTTVRKNIDDPTYPAKDKKVFRSATLWKLQHRATGFVFYVAGYHLRANDTDGTSRNQSRLAAARDVKNLIGSSELVLVAGDWNDYGEGSGDVFGIIRGDLGLQTIKRRVDDFPNDNLNSYGTKRQGRHIDSILTRPAEWDIDYVAGVPSRKVSDHQLWLQADFVPRMGTTYGTAPGGVTHEVVFSYPRSGRRRFDLRFVQGENVLEAPRLRVDGDPFANMVFTLGKGEGNKTVHGWNGVRDGRLRRVAVYTDKLASTRARCDALAKRERGWRTLAPSVDSILVGDHPHAPVGSWELGDDILLEATLPHVGAFADWYRIVAWAPATDSTARLFLERADASTYGAPVPAPALDAPDEEEQGDR